MDLHDYAIQEGGTGTINCPVLARLAEKTKYSRATLYMVSLGHKTPGYSLALALDVATDGAVTKHDLRPDIFGNQPERAA